MSRLFALTTACAFLTGVTSIRAQDTPAELEPAHFVFYGLDRERITEQAFLETTALVGAQLKYRWRELEKRRGEYDFSMIHHDLELLELAGKRLFIQLQDVSFVTVPNVPGYLIEDPEFGGGVASQHAYRDEEGGDPRITGSVPRRWDPAVRARLTALFEALAEEFDGRLAGINYPETSAGFGSDTTLHPEGYSYAGYYEGILEIMRSLRAAFEYSDVMIYANFMPGEELPNDDKGFLRGVYRVADSLGIGVGGPDLLPRRWFQRQNSLPLIAARAPGTIAGLAVQDGNLADVDRRTGEQVTVEELAAYARAPLHLDYVFWGTEEPYWSEMVVPFLRALSER